MDLEEPTGEIRCTQHLTDEQVEQVKEEWRKYIESRKPIPLIVPDPMTMGQTVNTDDNTGSGITWLDVLLALIVGFGGGLWIGRLIGVAA